MDEWIRQLCVRAAVAGLYAVTEQEARQVGERIAAAAMREQLVESPGATLVDMISAALSDDGG